MASDTQNESLKATIYVDTQNLGYNRTVSTKSEVIEGALSKWHGHLPSVSRIRAYIDPSQENYWKESLGRFISRQQGAFTIGVPGLETIETPSVQRYGRHLAKNALDITLVLDALSDLTLGRVDFAAIISSDSDFASLYFKLRELVDDGQLKPRAQIGGVPLLLFTHDRSEISDEIRGNLHENIIHVTTGAPSRPIPESGGRPALPTPPPAGQTISSPSLGSDATRAALLSQFTPEQIAGGIANGIGQRHFKEGSQIYEFRINDVYNVVRNRWPGSPEAAYGRHEDLSRWFHDNVWPVMEKYGATISNNHERAPRSYQYNLTRETREKLRSLNPEQ